MDNVFWVFSVIFMIVMFCMGIYIHIQRRAIQYYRDWMHSIVTNSNLLLESLDIVASAYGYASTDELMDTIERDRNAKGRKK